VLWFGLKDIEYSGEIQDFNTPLSKLLFSIGALVTQAWIIYEFSIEQSTYGFNIITSLGFFKSKPKTSRTDSVNKKRKNAGMC